MLVSFPEADWRKLRALGDSLFERLDARLLQDVQAALQAPGSSASRVASIEALLRERNRLGSAIAPLFKRSKALILVVALRQASLLTDEELDSLSEGTRDVVLHLLDAS
jgi:hypothetical protein